MNELIIPIVVEALLSDGKTSDHKKVPVTAPDYKKVSYVSFLGSRNTPGDFQRTSALDAGVHLHFILPDALTCSGEEGYPAVPNRYIVTRLYADQNKNEICSKCFVVESDFMSIDKKYGESVTIPRFMEENPLKNWRYLGRNYPVDAMPKESESDGYLEKLTAVGAGDPMFAAYYPSCSSVFGFHDDLEDVPLNTSLTYTVMGYYANLADDPFSNVKTWDEFQEVLVRMRLSVEDTAQLSAQDTAQVCGRCVLFGEICGILWEGTSADYSFSTGGQIDVAVGNTSAEALSAAVVRAVGESTRTERLLTALQYDLADSGNLTDGNYKIDDEIFFRQFQRLEGGGVKHELVLPKDGEQNALGEAVSKYNREERQLSLLKQQLEYLRAKLFYSWEQYMLCYEDPRHTPPDIPAKDEMLKEIDRICTEEIALKNKMITDQKALVNECREKLLKSMREGENLSDMPEEPYYLPKDPVILLSGPGVKRTYAYGEDGRFTSDGTLKCQTDVITANVKKEDVCSCISDTSYIAVLPESIAEVYGDLLYQAVLLGSDSRPVIEQRLTEIKIYGGIPSPAAVNTYHKDPIILFMEWETRYLPTRSCDSPDNTRRDWTLSADETTYHYTGNLTPDQITPRYFSGRTVLTPHAILQFSDALSRWLDKHDNPEAAEIAEKMKDLGVISQNLDGFTKAFSALKQTFQFPIIGAGGDEAKAAMVAANVLQERISVIPEKALFSLRGGYLGINQLTLVGSFGQIQNVSESSYFGSKEICFSETMETFNENYARMPPAFTTPVRLNFDFVSAVNDEILSSASADTSPIYGIIVPELLNGRLMVYQADGSYAGAVCTSYLDGKVCARWNDGKKPERKFAEAELRDERLRNFIDGLLHVEYALTDMLKLMDRYFEHKLIPGELNLVWGRPFVLVRCEMEFEFLGGAEFTKGYADFGKYDTKNAHQIRFPVMFGGLERAADGVLGSFCDDYGFTGMAPASGMPEEGTGSYILPQNQFQIAAGDGKKRYTLLMEPHTAATIHTGLLPVKTVMINAAHTDLSDHISMAAEINPIITGKDSIQLPLEGYAWKYNGNGVYMQNQTCTPMTDFDERVIMDGFIMKEGK